MVGRRVSRQAPDDRGNESENQKGNLQEQHEGGGLFVLRIPGLLTRVPAQAKRQTQDDGCSNQRQRKEQGGDEAVIPIRLQRHGWKLER